MCHWELLLTASKSEKAQFLHWAYKVLNNDTLYLISTPTNAHT